MLELSACTPLRIGYHRAVYRHPHDPDLLIKTMLPAVVAKHGDASGHWLKGLRRARQYTGDLREIKEYLAAHSRSDADPPLARIAGLVDTDLGLGLVCEKVRGEDGDLAPTLLKCWRRDGGAPPWGASALQAFHDGLLRNNVIVGDLHPGNLVYGSDSRGGPRVLMVDGFGEKGAIPLSSMSQRFNRHYVERRYRRLLRRLAMRAGG